MCKMAASPSIGCSPSERPVRVIQAPEGHREEPLVQRFHPRMKRTIYRHLHHPLTTAFVIFGIAILSGCGGAGQDDASQSSTVVRQASSPQGIETPSAQTVKRQIEGALLNAEELTHIAQTGVLPQPFDGPSLSGEAEGGTIAKSTATRQKAATSRLPVYRFFNNRTNAHFFTTSATERNNVIATLPFMSYEGPAFYASGSAVPGLSPVHRFYNTATGVHFYTISESERAHVVATLPQFTYEGIAYYASTLAGTGYTPLFRFFYSAKGFHFYTNSATERDNIIATLPQYSYEGVGYYVLGGDWQTPAIPHTGITNDQCFKAGSGNLVVCESLTEFDAIHLNAQQDGHRRLINPMSYRAVGNHAITECVLDNVTGLVWEGKTATGPRAGNLLFTNAVGNAGGVNTYIAAVNSSNLCGYSDWRLPTREELLNLVNFGQVSGPKISIAWFSNTEPADHWTASPVGDGAASIWAVNFSNGWSNYILRSAPAAIRLVHGAAWNGQRYLITSASYGDDAANNAVIDRKTGLTWRRCLEGWLWDGSTCINVVSTRETHEVVLAASQEVTGWRLPNVKELSSLADFSRLYPTLDTTAFPAGTTLALWASTPETDATNRAWVADFAGGSVYTNGRSTSSQDKFYRRLVRSAP
jgi:hypothetical protein